MITEYRAADAFRYMAEYSKPFTRLESDAEEATVVGKVLNRMHRAGIISHHLYSEEAFCAHREKVWSLCNVPWSTITPRTQRLLYAINAIVRPQHMIAAGISYGYSFLANAGAAFQTAAGHEPSQAAIGVEIDVTLAGEAMRNVEKVDMSGASTIVAAEAAAYMGSSSQTIDLIYLDTGEYDEKKSYLEILQAAMGRCREGTVVLAHDSVRFSSELTGYLEWVRDSRHCIASMNVVVDRLGLEVSILRGGT